MYTIFLTVIFMLTVSIKTFAQQMIPKQKGVELSYSVFPNSVAKKNYNIAAGIISYAKNGNYLFALAEYNKKYYEAVDYSIPVNTYLFNGGYSFYLLGDDMRNVNVNLGMGVLIGYEEINKGNEMLHDGSLISETENFIYGVTSKLSVELYLTGHFVFIVNGQLRFLQNSGLNKINTLCGLGLRYNF
ncbi:conjugal transfer protein TraO [Chryseobacterium sp. MMS23-Vi53]|uniref:conjugal transfer protein TraO n=1 Tax=Chryseobacterium sp. MMS23-Vi53 TaxID=3386644 RepID=UPI0039E8E4BF